MKRLFSVALAVVLAGRVAIGLPLIQSPTESTTNRVSLGARVVLRVAAISSVSPALSYQWRFGTGDIPGATNAVLVLDGVRTNQAGTYAVSVSDADGTTTEPAWVVLIGPTFTKIANDPISKGSGAQGIALGDFNQDGWIDVFCTARSSPTTTLFLNNGDGSFAPAAGTIGAKLVNPVGATWGDYDNDGALDLFISNNNGGNDSLLRNNGAGFTAITKGSIVSSGGNGNGCAWGDYDRDGLLDLYVANSDGNNFLFHADPNGTFTRILTGPMVSGTGGSQGCAWIDYDNDGYPVLYVSGVPNLLFHNSGNGTFSKVPTASFAAGTGGLGFAWGDYDNDGWPDLFLANGGTNNVLYHNNGNGSFTKVNSPMGADSGTFATVNWIDYDNDGWLDLFATDLTAGAKCRLYHNNGDGTFTRVFGSPLLTDTGRWFAAAWGDINNDGFPDVLLSNINNPNVMHRNDGNDNHWLTVRCQGRVSNRSAIGAKVRIEATIFGRTLWQVREISSGGNIGDQNQLDPMFGLGDAAVVQQLVVEWPSGTRQVTPVHSLNFPWFTSDFSQEAQEDWVCDNRAKRTLRLEVAFPKDDERLVRWRDYAPRLQLRPEWYQSMTGPRVAANERTWFLYRGTVPFRWIKAGYFFPCHERLTPADLRQAAETIAPLNVGFSPGLPTRHITEEEALTLTEEARTAAHSQPVADALLTAYVQRKDQFYYPPRVASFLEYVQAVVEDHSSRRGE